MYSYPVWFGTLISGMQSTAEDLNSIMPEVGNNKVKKTVSVFNSSQEERVGMYEGITCTN